LDNQHRKISGRELSQAEIDLMNRIKAHAEETRALVIAVREAATPRVELMVYAADADNEAVEFAAGSIGIGHDAGPLRWVGLADDHLQQGFMALTRAVAQPTTY
jgi:hypothetical protein